MELDSNLNKKRQERIPVIPERDLGDRSVPYSKLEMTGRVKRADFSASGADADTTNKGIASFSSDDFTTSGGVISLIDSPSNGGWIPITGTFTYASATTINVSSGAASIYSVGDKLRFQNNDSGTYLYAYVITIADTLLTVVGDAVPNATLTDTYYSKVANPLGFPHWFTWTPTYTASGSMTYASVTNHIARYSIVGKTVFVQLSAQGTTGGTASNIIYFNLPVAVSAAYDAGDHLAGACMLYDGSHTVGQFTYQTSNSKVGVLKTNVTGNWNLGASKWIWTNFHYEID